MLKRFLVMLCIISVSVLQAQVVDTTIYAIQSERDAQNNSLWLNYTVRISGVVSALTGVTGSRNIFVQMRPGGPWSGVMIYIPSSAGQFPSVSLGDSVTITGTVLEYYNNTELQVNNVADYIFITNTNPITPMVITCGHLDTTQASDLYPYQPDSAEAYEGVLVKIENAYITRTGLGNNNEFEITDGTGFVIVRNNFSYTPTQGDAMNITGIVEERTLGGVRYYMLRPRSINDYEFLLPGISDAFSIDMDKIMIKFKTAVNYSMGSNPSYYVVADSATGTPLQVMSAEVSPQDPKVVVLTTQTMTDAERYMIYTPGLRDAFNQAITDTFYFYGGFVPITLIQSDTLPDDSARGFRSRWDGRSVTVTGVITAWKDLFVYPFFFVQQGEGPWTALHGWDPVSFIPVSEMNIGDSVILVGEILEYGNNAVTEIQNFKYYRVVSSGHVVNPVQVPLRDLRNEAGAISEQWEHVLVEVEPPVFVYDVGTGGDWRIYEVVEPDTFVLTVEGDYTRGYYWRPTEVHQQIDKLAGILRFRGTLYPRTDADITPSNLSESIKNSNGSILVRSSMKFNVPENAKKVEVDLFGIDGRKVKTLYSGRGTSSSLKADLSEVKPGAYFMVISADGKVTSTRVIVTE